MMPRAGRDANRYARRSIDKVGVGDDNYLWAFFCECDDPDCLELVALTVTEFDELFAEPGRRVLAREHLVAQANRVGAAHLS